jgi:tRNA nucleotidyltransferase (CCA-adding enzyme)
MKQLIDQNKIPTYVTHVTSTLEKAGFEAFLVGGCVRDLILEREPKDWDVTTNATPEEIIPLFEKTIYENAFGTVGVCVPKVTHETGENVTQETQYHIIEVTPYRTEAQYSDNRHPDEVLFSKHVEDDLQRRDFTINAMAFSSKGQIIDLYKGQQDLKDKVVRAVGEPDERFKEDGLRMLRAIRFSTQLGFAINYETMQAVENNSGLIKNISSERIRDEFVKIIESPNSTQGIVLLQKLGLLKHIIPELEEGIGCEQGGAHIYDVFEHLLGALGNATDKGYSTEIRLAALFHDIGKPRSRRPGTKKAYTFYGHEVIGARMTKVIMERLKFPKKSIDLVVSMVRNHMFFSDTEAITLSAVRRIIAKVGVEHIWELMQIRECDRVGMNKKEAPYRLRKYHAMIEECLRDPISVGQLKIDGNYLMNEMQMKPGPRMGWILNALLEEVLEDPNKNEIGILKERVGELEKLNDKDLKALGDKAKEKKEELEEQEITQLHKKHGVS